MLIAMELLDIASISDNAELVRLASKIPQVLKSSISSNTFKSYTSGFKKWSVWCNKFNFKVFPAEQKHLLLFISELIDKKVSVATLNSVCYSISWIHGISGKVDPFKSPVLVKMKEGAKRILSRPCVQKEPLSFEALEKIVLKYGHDVKHLSNVRFATMCAIGFYGFLRFSELSNLRRSDLKIFDDHIDIFIEKSKTDKYRQGSSVLIAANGEKTCPKTCLINYLSAAKIKSDSRQFLFGPIIKTSNGYRLDKKRKLSYTRTREILLEKLQDLGFDKSKFGLHSLRSGGATASYSSGVPDRLIMKHGRWKSEKSKDRYIHETVKQRLQVTHNIS